MTPLRLCKVSQRKTLKEATIFQKKSHSSATSTDKFWGTKALCSGTLPGRGSAPEAISIDIVAFTTVSIDFTAISTNIVVSHDEEGVVLPRG
jgi:hypothetical protein